MWIDTFLHGQLCHAPLCASANTAAKVGLGRSRLTSRQDKLLQRRQVFIHLIQLQLQPEHHILSDNGIFRISNCDFTADIKKVVLDLLQEGAKRISSFKLSQKYSQQTVEFIHIPQCLNARMVFGNTLSIGERGSATVSTAGIDTSQAVAHDFSSVDKFSCCMRT